VIDDCPNILQDFQKILCPADGFISNAWAECSHDLFDEPFPHPGKEPFDLDCVDNGMSVRDLVRKAKAQGSPFALVFLDGKLPNGWDRIETVESIRDEDSSVQVVLCGAYPVSGWSEVLPRLGRWNQI